MGPDIEVRSARRWTLQKDGRQPSLPSLRDFNQRQLAPRYLLLNSNYLSGVSNEYWRVKVDGRSRDKTALALHRRLQKSIPMPFGLPNAPSTFQRSMNTIQSLVKKQFALVYLDGVVIFSKPSEQHIDHVCKMLTVFKNAGVTLKLQ